LASEITFALGSAGSNALSDDYGADGWHYIYLDDTAIITNASPLLVANCFLNDTTAPTWSVTKHGWYNGNDRCIFAVYETGDAILVFWHDGGDYVAYDALQQVRGSSDLDATFVDVDCTTAMPGFAVMGQTITQLETKTADAIVLVYQRPNGSAATSGTIMGALERIGTDQIIYFENRVTTDSGQIFEVKASRNGDDIVYIAIIGWYFPTGM
jgi:hypothetical protein